MVIAKKGQKWYLRYRTSELVRNREGELVRKEVWKAIAAVDERYQSKRDVEPLARDIFNRTVAVTDEKPGASQRLSDFIKNTYFPAIEAKYEPNGDAAPKQVSGLSPSTVVGYKKIFDDYLNTRLGDTRLFDFDAAAAQRLLREIADTQKKEDGSKLAHRTLKNIKHFMSAVITFAIQEGALKMEHNPIQLIKVPEGAKTNPTRAYDLNEIAKMMEVLPEPANTVVATAAFTGLRRGEIRGLKWQDLDAANAQVFVRQTVWRTVERDRAKTKASEAPVPLVPMVEKLLEAHRNGFPPGDYIFIGEKLGRSLNLENLARRVIAPKLKKAGVRWAGWHGFRRGLATNLYAIGTDEKIIRDICRHANVEVTRAHYIKPSTALAQPAIKNLVKVFEKVQKSARKSARRKPGQ
jgi:integrase